MLGVLNLHPSGWDRIVQVNFHDTNGNLHGFRVSGWSFYNRSYMVLYTSHGDQIKVTPSSMHVLRAQGGGFDALLSDNGEVVGNMEMRREGDYPIDVMREQMSKALYGPDDNGEAAIAEGDDDNTCCADCGSGYTGGRPYYGCDDYDCTCTVYVPPHNTGSGGDDDDDDSDECFAGSTQVMVRQEDGTSKTILMRELAAGDYVLTADADNNKLVYEPVLGFGFRSGSRSANRLEMEYVELELAAFGSQVLRATPLHLLGVLRDVSKPDDMEYTFMENVKVGDWVLAVEPDCTASDCALVPTQVNATRTIKAIDGWFAPLTPSGRIVVSRVVASCYAMWSHSFMHTTSAPLRWYWQTAGPQAMAAPQDETQNLIGFPGLWHAKNTLLALAGPGSL